MSLAWDTAYAIKLVQNKWGQWVPDTLLDRQKLKACYKGLPYFRTYDEALVALSNTPYWLETESLEVSE